MFDWLSRLFRGQIFAETPDAHATSARASASASRGPSRYDDEYEDGDRRNYSYAGEKLKAGVPIPAFLPYFDLQQTADETMEMRFAYRRMLSDPTVKANVYAKIMSVMALDLVVKPPKWLKKDKRAIEHAEFVAWNLKDGLDEGLTGLVWDVLSGALIDGFSVCEKVWGDVEEKGKWKGKRRLARLKAKDVNQDLVLELDEFKNIKAIRGLRYNAGGMFNPRDFVIYSHLGLFENPTGMSDFRAAYSRYWLLDTVWKLRAIACEKRALPIIVGHWTDAFHQPKLEAALARVRYQNWISAPETARIEALEISGQSHQIFSETVRDLREEITVAIKGAMLQSMTGQGPRGNSQVHKDTSDLFSWHLSAAVTHILNAHNCGLIPEIIDRNYAGVGDYPRGAFGGIDDAELGESLKIDQGLSQLLQPMGKQLVVDELEERYGRTFEDAPMALDAMGGGGAGGEGGEPTDEDYQGILGALGGDDGGDDGNSDDGANSDAYSEADWARAPGPISNRRWVNSKTGEIAYSDENPGGKDRGGGGADSGKRKKKSEMKAGDSKGAAKGDALAKKYAAKLGPGAGEKLQTLADRLESSTAIDAPRKLAAVKALMARVGESDKDNDKESTDKESKSPSADATPTPAAKSTDLHESTKKVLSTLSANAKSNGESAISKLAKETGEKPEELKRKLAEAWDKAEVTINFHPAYGELIASSGSFKNAYEANNKDNAYLKTRSEKESDIFGADSSMPNEERPRYAAVNWGNNLFGAASQYGDANFVMNKDAIKDRMSLVHGNSFGHSDGSGVGSHADPFAALTKSSNALKAAGITSHEADPPFRYTEVQAWGQMPINKDTVKEIRCPADQAHFAGMKAMEDFAEKAGIPLNYFNPANGKSMTREEAVRLHPPKPANKGWFAKIKEAMGVA